MTTAIVNQAGARGRGRVGNKLAVLRTRSGRTVLLADAFDCGQGRCACDADAYAPDVADAFHALYKEVYAQ